MVTHPPLTIAGTQSISSRVIDSRLVPLCPPTPLLDNVNVWKHWRISWAERNLSLTICPVLVYSVRVSLRTRWCSTLVIEGIRKAKMYSTVYHLPMLFHLSWVHWCVPVSYYCNPSPHQTKTCDVISRRFVCVHWHSIEHNSARTRRMRGSIRYVV